MDALDFVTVAGISNPDARGVGDIVQAARDAADPLAVEAPGAFRGWFWNGVQVVDAFEWVPVPVAGHDQGAVGCG